MPKDALVIKIKRAYEKTAEADGARYLVDRLWPRGIKKADARLTEWLKGLAPSHELRRWFDHNPERWDEFQERYAAELEASRNMILIEGLADRARNNVTVTLVYAARDQEHNNALVLNRLIEERQKKG